MIIGIGIGLSGRGGGVRVFISNTRVTSNGNVRVDSSGNVRVTSE